MGGSGERVDGCARVTGGESRLMTKLLSLDLLESLDRSPREGGEVGGVEVAGGSFRDNLASISISIPDNETSE